VGGVGAVICWENRMPLARWAVYRGGPQIWVAPTADDSDGCLASMRHIAIESGAFVVSAPQFIPRAAFPEDFPVKLPADRAVFGRGGAAIVEPTRGEVIVGPLYDEEGSWPPTAACVPGFMPSAGLTRWATLGAKTCWAFPPWPTPTAH
jgi:nitrilase